MDREHEALQRTSFGPMVGSTGVVGGASSQERRRAQPLNDVTAALGGQTIVPLATDESHFLSTEEVELSVRRFAFGGYAVREQDPLDFQMGRPAGQIMFATNSIGELLEFVEARLAHARPVFDGTKSPPRPLPRTSPVTDVLHTPLPLLETNIIKVLEAWFGGPLGRDGLLRLRAILQERNLPFAAVDH